MLVMHIFSGVSVDEPDGQDNPFQTDDYYPASDSDDGIDYLDQVIRPKQDIIEEIQHEMEDPPESQQNDDGKETEEDTDDEEHESEDVSV